MFTKQIGESEYTRFESDDWSEIEGKRINGHGEIIGYTNAEGEHHPAFVRTDNGSMFTPAELKHDVEWDGRHNLIDI